jgi:hypothetical protein
LAGIRRRAAARRRPPGRDHPPLGNGVADSRRGGAGLRAGDQGADARYRPRGRHLEVANWAARDDVVFIEYEIAGSVAGRRLRWTGIGRFKLRGERAVDAIGRWDNLDLLAQLDPSVRRTAFAEAAAANANLR